MNKDGINRELSFWVTVVIIFGLLQFFIDFTFKFLNGEDYYFQGLINSGGLLFFSSSIIASTAVDVWLAKELKDKLEHLTYSFLHQFIPLILIVLIVIVYMVSVNINPTIDKETLALIYQRNKVAQIGVFLISLTYTIIAKQHLLSHPKNSN